MPTVAVVRLRYVPKQFWFDPNGIEIEEGDHLVVETERGIEIGLSVSDPIDVDEKDLVAPLKPVLRIATDEDFAKVDQMAERGKEAMPRFRELVEKEGLDMKPISVDFQITGDRAVFYFAADERVDFRSLVRDLASEFHVRVDMRQIGVRDEARMLGGFGHCGEELCCARLGGGFQPVSIRMAKEQDLPLNPTKISGLCGRLMCCLRYEFEAYKDFKTRAPKKSAIIETPAGLAKVIEFDTPREKLRLRFEDGKSIMVPLSSMDTGDKKPKEGERLRPCHISPDAFDQILEDLHHDDKLVAMGEKLFTDNPNLADTEAKAGAIERNPRRRKKTPAKTPANGGNGKKESREPAQRNPRKRRRSVTVDGDEKPRKDEDGQESRRDQTAVGGGKSTEPKKTSRSRNNRRKKGPNAQKSAPDARDAEVNRQSREQGESQEQAPRPRPGQHSSTLTGDRPAAAPSKNGSGNRRRRRRRPSNTGSGGQSAGSGNEGRSDGGGNSSAPGSEN